MVGMHGGGGSRRRVGGRAAWRRAAPVRRFLRRLRSSLRRSAARPAAVRFGYDQHSYSQNFDDGLGSSGHHRL
uniref:Uncharacterized protein n=1 Tax=Arundo donax TaxID=35708 RepID=A0A0A9BTY4_ARUDO